MTSFYRDQGIGAEIHTFFDDVPERMARAQVVIARAGASTIADLTVIGRPAILIPYAAAAEDHQTANARGLEAAGGAEVMPEAGFTPEALTARLAGLVSQPERAVAMARASLGYGKPDAAERLAELVDKLSRNEKGGRA